ncbi:hypothetical protein LTR85_000389 [Meristemomyces frigidus]|nr:hypothetical protein LTR85_000389 [Meristemomyces frigidus]
MRPAVPSVDIAPITFDGNGFPSPFASMQQQQSAVPDKIRTELLEAAARRRERLTVLFEHPPGLGFTAIPPAVKDLKYTTDDLLFVLDLADTRMNAAIKFGRTGPDLDPEDKMDEYIDRACDLSVVELKSIREEVRRSAVVDREAVGALLVWMLRTRCQILERKKRLTALRKECEEVLRRKGMLHEGSAMSSNSPQTEPLALDQAKHTVKQPASAFVKGDSLHKQVWAAELTEEELEELLEIAHTKLEAAIRRQVKALVKEAEKLKRTLDQGLRVADHEDHEDLKGDICAKVMERWEFEKRVVEMTGRL